MTWVRQAGGFWIDPRKPDQPVAVPSHGPYAWQVLCDSVMNKQEEADLLNQHIGDTEQKDLVVNETPGGDQKVDYKGTGGAEAKAEAEKRVADEKRRRVEQQYGVGSELAAGMKLQELGWVRVNTDSPDSPMVMANSEDAILAAQDVIMAEAMKADLLILVIGHEQINILPQELGNGLKAAIDGARARTPATSSGLGDGMGSWRVSPRKQISFISKDNIKHNPERPQGKQWSVLSESGKELASGPSRKWAERKARGINWTRKRPS